MRSGVCALQQTLTAEAASALKHSLALARRRGHAQVTPLHVAATLLASRASLLRRACLRAAPAAIGSSRALELCFNVALNRLPTAPGPLLHGQPSLSNALVAALKRAQAHHRRGCAEQQPLLAAKVELEQLVVSILDDPSVSRVMREAGFSSTAVKASVEDSSSAASSVFHCFAVPNPSGGVFSSPSSPNYSSTPAFSPFLFSPPKKPITFGPGPLSPAAKEDDVKSVFAALSRTKKRNVVIVGDTAPAIDALLAELKTRWSRGDVPEQLHRMRFIEHRLVSPVSERRVSELKSKVAESLSVSGDNNGRVVIYVGDLQWTVEDGRDHLIEEIASLISQYDAVSSPPKLWIMASASYQTYMRCQAKQPSMELQWGLQAVSVPSGGLGLSLRGSANSSVDERRTQSPYFQTSPDQRSGLNKLACCAECAAHCEKEAQSLKAANQKLPPWLRPHATGPGQSHKDDLVELSKNWSRLCRSLHHGRQAQTTLTPIALFNNGSFKSPPWRHYQSTVSHDATSIAFADPASKPRFRRQNSCTIEFGCGDQPGMSRDLRGPGFGFLRSGEGKEEKITLALGNSFSSSSWRCEEANKPERGLRRAEMCRVLKENVPWQSEAIPSVVEAMIVSETARRETWLLIQGNDAIGKRRLARAMAESMLGSADLLVHLDMKQKKRNTANQEFSKIVENALQSRKNAVVLVEDVDLADAQFMKYLSYGFETGKFGSLTGKDAEPGKPIFILTKSDETNHETIKKRKDSVIQMTISISEKAPNTRFEGLKLDHKRKAAEWETPIDRSKSPKKTGEFTRLDLNVEASDDKQSPNTSDLTGENPDPPSPSLFLDSIEHVLVFNRSPARDREMKELFLGKMEACFGKIIQITEARLSVDEGVLEEICVGSASFSNGLFEKWTGGVFERAAKSVRARVRGKEKGGGVVVRVCLGGFKEGGILEEGFIGSCLPCNFQLISPQD